MIIERAKLKLLPSSYIIDDLKLVGKKLNHVSYIQYKAAQNQVHEYTTEQVKMYTVVQSQRHPDAPHIHSIARPIGAIVMKGYLNKIHVCLK